MKVKYFIDPPQGWLYGFPKEIPFEILTDYEKIQNFLRKEGYPEEYLQSTLLPYRILTTEIEENE